MAKQFSSLFEVITSTHLEELDASLAIACQNPVHISEHKAVQYNESCVVCLTFFQHRADKIYCCINGSAVSADAGELWVWLVGSSVLCLEGRSLTR